MPQCPIYQQCGGCHYPHKDYKKSLQAKTEAVAKLLGVRVDAVHPSPEIYHYRNKVHAAFTYEKRQGKMGKFAKGSKAVLEVKDCLLEDRRAQTINHSVKELAQSFKWSFYDYTTQRGLLRSSLVRVGRQTGQILLTIVVTSPQIPSRKKFVQALRKAHPEIDSIVFNINSRETSFILGKDEIVAYGPGYIFDRLLGHEFRISSQSFYQVNSEVCELLYRRIGELGQFTGEEILIDAYSGIGSISICLASQVKQVYGVESNPAAVRDAIFNAKHNHINNSYFVNMDAGEYLQGLRHEKLADVLVLDPAREGLDSKLLSALRTLPIETIIYVSCNPLALKRDLQSLTKHYKIQRLEVFDMFPWTRHVETVVLLSKLDVEEHINQK